MISYLLPGAAYGLAAAVPPVPFQAFLVFLALRKGWRRALPAVSARALAALGLYQIIPGATGRF